MIPDSLVPSLINYTRIFNEARSPRVAIWTRHFINQCVDWCLMIEAELAVLSDEDIQKCQMLAQQQLSTDWQLTLPSLPILLDAFHQFYLCLIQNMYLPQESYHYLLSTYQFLNSSDSVRENITQDLTILANNAATCKILNDMEKILLEDDDDKSTN